MKRTLAFVSFAIVTTVSATAMAQQTSAQSGSLEATQVEMRLADVEDQMRALNGQVEQLGYVVRRLERTLQRLQGDYDQRLSKIEESVSTAVAASASAAKKAEARTYQSPETRPSAAPIDNGDVETPPAPVPVPNGTLGNLKLQDGKITGGSVNPQVPALPETPPDYGLTTQEQYTRAFELLRQTNYGDAEKAFKSFIDKNPQDKLIENAKYWYAETLYARGNFADAARAFADSYQQNAKGTKAPDSLLKLAMSLAATNKIPESCTVLTELKGKYTSASAPIKARASELRSKLKCGAN